MIGCKHDNPIFYNRNEDVYQCHKCARLKHLKSWQNYDFWMKDANYYDEYEMDFPVVISQSREGRDMRLVGSHRTITYAKQCIHSGEYDNESWVYKHYYARRWR